MMLRLTQLITKICVTLVVTSLFLRLLVVTSQASESGNHTNINNSECYCESELSRRKYDVEGGWKYDKDVIHDNHVAFDDGFGDEIVRYIQENTPNKKGQVATMVDIGAGVGQLGAWLRENNVKTIEWQGYDGGSNVNDFCGQTVMLREWEILVPKVCFLDASKPVYEKDLPGAPFDWVLSVEVGEHIPVDGQNNFIDNLVRLSAHGIILSWALPGQGGHMHVNEQPNEVIVKLMEERGMRYDYTESMKMRQEVQDLGWLRNTVMVFTKPGTPGLLSKWSTTIFS